MIRIRDPRPAGGRLTGNVKIKGGTFAYACPRVWAELRDPRLKEFFAARLRGEYAPLPKEQK